MTVAYGLWAPDLAGRNRDDVTEAMVAYLLKTQRREGNWTVGGRRSPLEESPAMATVLAAYEMEAFATP